MSTATMSRTDALSRVRELEQEAETVQKEYDEKMDAIGVQMEEAAAAFRSGASTNGSGNGRAANSAPPPARRRQANQPAANSAPQARGRKPSGKKVSGKVAPNQRNYTNEMSLRQAIWNVLDRSPEDWDKVVADLPENAEGLQISEIKEVIEKEKKWVSASENISPQLQSQLYGLKKDGKIARGDDSRYYIVQGATLDKAPGKKRGK